MLGWGTNEMDWDPTYFDPPWAPFGPYYGDAILAVDDSFIVSAGYQFAHDIWRFTQSLVWTNVGFSDQVVGGIAAGNGRIIIVGWEGWPRVSINGGERWFAVASDVITSNAYQPPAYSIPMVGSDITFGNGTFLVARSYLRNGFLTTLDGITWSKREAFTGASIESVAYGNGTFVAACSGELFPAGIYQSEIVALPILRFGHPSEPDTFTLLISGKIGDHYRLQTSTNLEHWDDEYSFTASSPTTPCIVKDQDPTVPRRFYRVASP